MPMLLAGRFLGGAGSAEAVNRRFIADTIPPQHRTAASVAFVTAAAIGMYVCIDGWVARCGGAAYTGEPSNNISSPDSSLYPNQTSCPRPHNCFHPSAFTPQAQ